METPSQLDLFLSNQTTEGRLDSEGHFTMAREQALRKLAEFQLPFRAAWAVKIIQCAVAHGTDSPIRVDLTAGEARFYFEAPNLQLDEIEREFYNPEAQGEAALGHLLSALWAVGIREQWAFQIATPHDPETLIWDGERLNRVDSEIRHNCAYLAVSMRTKNAGKLEWVQEIVNSGAQNAEILTTLNRWCYTVPVPLTVDGRRVDSLYHCRSHGANSSNYPLTVGFGEGELRKVGIPPGTFEELPPTKDPRYKTLSLTHPPPKDGGGLQAISDSVRQRLQPVDECSVPFLLTAHLEWAKHNNKYQWNTNLEFSMAYWVRDGVVVDQEHLTGFPSHCSVAVFLQADGLPSDLTSFHLARCQEREDRLKTAKEIVANNLDVLGTLSEPFEQMISRGQKKHRLIGGGLLLLGVASFWASPFHGLGLVAGGAALAKSAGAQEKSRVQNITTAVELFQSQLRKELDGLGVDMTIDPADTGSML
jgi:hypothetical protein